MRRLVVTLNLWQLLIPIWIYVTDKDFRNTVVIDLQRSLYFHPESKAPLYWPLCTL